MEKKPKKIFSVLVIVFVLVIGTANVMVVLGEGRQETQGDIPVLVYTEDSDEIVELDRHGRIVDEYGRNTLLMVEEEEIEFLKQNYEVELLEERTELYVKGYEFDRQEGFPDFAEKLNFENVDESVVREKLTIDESELRNDDEINTLSREIYLVQMLGPRNPEWRVELEEMEIDIIGSVHNYGYEVRMSSERAEKVEELEFVDWVAPYQPGFKIAPELTMDLEKEIADVMENIETMSSSAYTSKEMNTMQRDIEETIRKSQPNYPDELVVEVKVLDGITDSALGEVFSCVDRIESTSTVSDGILVRAVIADQADLLDLARISDVYHISLHLEPQFHEMSSQIVGGGSWHWAPQWEWENGEPVTPVHPYRDDSPEWAEAGPLTAQLGYTGEDVKVSVADTGIGDGTLGDAGHPDYTGRIISGFDWDSRSTEPGQFWDSHGHGSAVAGVVASDSYHGTEYTIDHEELAWTDIEPGGYWGEDYYASMGVAPEAEMHVSRIVDDGGNIVLPDDLREVPEQAIQQEPDLFGQTHSWGMMGAHGGYPERTRHIDQAVRDANRETEEEEPVVITFSAGNDGARGANTIGEPGGTAKNVISVGGTENYQPDAGFMEATDNADEYWPGASRGWTDDNRIKPDIAAPANNILTTYWYNDPAADPNYTGIAGTSFSSPAAQGGAAMIANWYEGHPLVEGRPSPAMVRALLTNTAYDLPEDHNDDGTIDHIPNKYEGWGRMDLTPFVDHDFPEGGPFMMFDRVNQEMEETYLETGDVEEYTLGPMDDEEPLKITLAWDDPAAPAGADPTLQNDLRLEVEDPAGNIYRGNAFSEGGGAESTSGFSYPETEVMSDFDLTGDGYDDVNNIRKVYIEDPEPSGYEIRVIGHDIPEYANDNLDKPNQDFALAVQNSFLDEDGLFSMDHHRYAEEDTIDFTVIDSDMMEQDTVDIDVISFDEDEEVDDLSVTLRGARTGIVTGSLDISPEFENDDDGLYVEHGFEIESIYYDQSMEEEKTEYAIVDGEPPEPASNIEVEWWDETDNLVTWNLSEDDDLEEFECYRIYRSESVDGEPNEWEHIETVEPGTDEYLDEGMGQYEHTRYWYEIGTVDDVGNEIKTGEPGIEPPSVRLDTPEGNEIWTSDDEENIEWYAATGGLEAEITVEYSTDAGESWDTILQGHEVEQGEGSYTWTVPEVEGTKYGSLVRISIEDVNENPSSIFDGMRTTLDGLGDTPWPLIGQNQRRTSQSPIDTSHNEGVQMWTFEADDNFNSASIGPDGTIYVGSVDHNLYAINPDGTEKWAYETGGPIGGPGAFGESSPAVAEDGTIYVGSDDSKLHAVNPDGTEKWTIEVPSDGVFTSPNIADDGTIYFGDLDNNIYSANPDGTINWAFTEIEENHYSRIEYTPAIGEDGTVYVGSNDEALYAINPDGTEKWSYPARSVGPPAIDNDGTIYFGSSMTNDLRAINPDGTEKWNFVTGGDITASPSIADDGTIYAPSADGNIYAINPDGTEEWRFDAGTYIIRGGSIGEDGRIYFGSPAGDLLALNLDGTEEWIYRTGAGIRNSPAICDDGILYFGAAEQLHAVGYPRKPYQVPEPEVTVDDELVELDWEEPPGDGGEPLTHYNVYRDGEVINQTEVIPEVMWRHRHHDETVTTVHEADGIVYSGSYDGKVVAYDYDDEEVLWEHEHHAGPVNSVFESDGVVYSGSDEGDRLPGKVIAADAEDGEFKWEHEHHGGAVNSVFESDGVVYSGSDEGRMPGKVIAADAEDGEFKWEHEHHSQMITDVHESDGVVYSSARDGFVLAYDYDDEEVLWEHQHHGARSYPTSIYESDGVVYSGGSRRDANIVAADTDDGELLWQHDRDIPDNEVSSVFESDGVVYSSVKDAWTPHESTVEAYDYEEEEVLWQHKHHDSGVTSVFESDGIVYSGSLDESVIAYNTEADDGTYYADTDVENWKEYTYEISAVNELGEGERSPPVTTIPKPVLPDAPVGGDMSDYFVISEYEAPSVEITSPEEGDVWYVNTTEIIEWETTEGDGSITNVELEYSLDSGETWNPITEETEDNESYEWNIPAVQSKEALIRIDLEDEYDLYAESFSDEFEIISAEPPENLEVDFVSLEEETVFHDVLKDGEAEEGYETGEYPEGINEWGVRDHGSFAGEYSWDFGDSGYEEVNGGGLSWLISPEIEIPEDSTEVELTFQHWRDFDYRYDGGNLRVSTDGEDWEIVHPEDGYTNIISDEFDNPLAGEPAWTESEDWNEVTIDLDDYIGETIQFNWSAGVDHWDADHEGWRIDDIEVTAIRPYEGEMYHADNRLTWDASPDDGAGEDNVLSYNIYRSESEDELGDHIDSVDAEGLENYRYFDEGAGTEDDITWWYTVRAVNDDEIEEKVGDSAQELEAPYPPKMAEPEHGSAISVEQHEITELSFKATHACSDTPMDVSFYDAETDIMIDEVTEVYPNERASVEWDQLIMGEHSWYVTVDDGDYIVGSDEWTFMVDLIDPEVNIFMPEDDEILGYSNVVVAWDGYDVMSGIDYYEVRLSGLIHWTDVGDETEVLISGVPDGEYVFDVRAMDNAGNQAIDTVEFTVNTQSPVVEMVRPEMDEVFGEDEVKLEWNGYDEQIDLAYYEVRLENGPWINVGLSESYTLTGLEEGENIIRVRGTDQADNRYTAHVIVVFDTTDPLVDITSPYDDETLDRDWVNVTWKGEDDISEIDKYEIRLNDQGWIDYDYEKPDPIYEPSDLLWEHEEHDYWVQTVYQSDGVVYSGAWDDTVIAYDIENEEILWQHEYHEERVNDVHEADGVVYSGSFDRTVVAVDAADGELIWQHEHNEYPVYSVYESDGVVYSGEGGDLMYVPRRVMAVDAEDGELLWQHQLHDDAVYSVHESDGVVYSSSRDGTVIAYDHETNDVLWQHDHHVGTVHSVYESNGVLYSGGRDDTVIAVDADNGEILWQHDLHEATVNSVTASDGVVYSGSLDESVIAFDVDGQIKLWQHEHHDGSVQSVFESDGTVYSGGRDGKVIAVAAEDVMPEEPLEFSHNFTNLPDGEHTVYIRATDNAGNQHTETVNFVIDTPEAELEIISPDYGVQNLTYDEEFTIEGQTDLDSTVYINGQEVVTDDEGYFEHEATLVKGQNVFEVKAEHPDGDVAETMVYALYLPQIPEMQDDIENL
ncbi:MAG: PQQ-binding-like beta-propeller repeat protein, partial [Candidatus Saliniplasma sp.]